MREYATPLSERLRLSRYHKERYATDPEFRLRKINKWRRWKGLEPYHCVSEIKTLADGGRAAAAKNRRDERGRYVG